MAGAGPSVDAVAARDDTHLVAALERLEHEPLGGGVGRMDFDQALDRRFLSAQIRGAPTDVEGDHDILVAVGGVQIANVGQVGVDVADVGDELVATAPKLGLIARNRLPRRQVAAVRTLDRPGRSVLTRCLRWPYAWILG